MSGTAISPSLGFEHNGVHGCFGSGGSNLVGTGPMIKSEYRPWAM